MYKESEIDTLTHYAIIKKTCTTKLSKRSEVNMLRRSDGLMRWQLLYFGSFDLEILCTHDPKFDPAGVRTHDCPYYGQYISCPCPYKTLRKINSYSASHDNLCTGTLWSRIMTAQCEGMGEVGSARYEPALLPPCPSIRVLSYSNCQRSTHSSRRAWQFKC